MPCPPTATTRWASSAPTNCSRPTNTTAQSSSGALRSTSASPKLRRKSFAHWGHDRVLYDAVLAVRRERPQIIVSTFVGGITDGHGHHQVSGEIAQEVFKAAADPTVFPEPTQARKRRRPRPHSLAAPRRLLHGPLRAGSQMERCSTTPPANGLRQSSKTTSPASGLNGVPSTDVTIQVGTRDPILGRSYVQIAREGWGQQKSQNGGANPTLSGPAATSYHLWAVAPPAAAKPGANRDQQRPLPQLQGRHRYHPRRPAQSGQRQRAQLACRKPSQHRQQHSKRRGRSAKNLSAVRLRA